ncbi:MAG: STAS domain-containing protein [Candidatus Eisenbacteria bacterium]
MFSIKRAADGRVFLSGRLDASQAEAAAVFLARVTESCDVDLAELDYISSAGLGVLLGAQKRLRDSGHGLRLHGMSGHIRDLFRVSGLDQVFEIF